MAGVEGAVLLGEENNDSSGNSGFTGSGGSTEDEARGELSAGGGTEVVSVRCGPSATCPDVDGAF